MKIITLVSSIITILLSQLRPISFDPVHNDYLVLGEKVGNAFSDGGSLK